MSSIFDLFAKIEKENQRADSSVEPISYLVAGLGNPGEKYARTRHNIGFMCIEYMSEKLGVRVNRAKYHALCGETVIAGRRVLLMKPQTYMNHSGEAVREAAAFYKLPPERIIILYDDVSLEPGRMRVRLKGSDGGHNGIKSVIYQLGSDQFPRVKIGVGAPPPQWDMINWVLGVIPDSDREAVYSCISDALPCAELLIGGETERAMNLYNQVKRTME